MAEFPERPLLKKKHKQVRLNNTKAHINKPETFWKKFYNRTKLEILVRKYRRYIWGAPNIAFKEKNVMQTVKHGSGSIMILGCFTAAGTGKIVRIDGTMQDTKQDTKQFCTKVSCSRFESRV